MGRQIHFYMSPGDRHAFLSYVQKDDLVAVVSQRNDSPIVRPLEERHVGAEKNVYLWNRRLLPHLRREWLPGPQYYGISELELPVLEFIGSILTIWEDKPALVQGRLYGVFDSYLDKPPEFQKWYDRLVQWIRKNYRRNTTSMGGYLGPDAYELFERGGYLLPQFLPPRTEVWLAEIGKQHSQPGKSGTDGTSGLESN